MADSIKPEIIAAHIKARCEADFGFFTRFFFKATKGRKFKVAEHHSIIDSHLMQMHAGNIPGLIINMPPRFSKTEKAHIMFPAWSFALNPRCEFLHLSYSAPLATENSDRVREILTHPAYQAMWPASRIRTDRRARHHWKTEAGGVFYAGAAGGAVTGMGAGSLAETDDVPMLDDRGPAVEDELADVKVGGNEIGPGGRFKFCGGLMIDDPLKPDDSRSPAKLDAVNRRWEETIKSRRNGPRTPTWLTMQRLGPKDFTAELLSDRSIDWTHVILPAILDEGLPTERSLWPDKISLETLKASRDRCNDRGEPNPLAQAIFRTQYQQQPTTTEGTLVKDGWWRYREPNAMLNYAYTIITADTAYTAKTSNDPTVLQLWALTKDTIHLLAEQRGWWDFPDLVQQAQAFWRAADRCQGMYIESKASGESLVQSLQKQGIKAISWHPQHYGYPEDKVGRLKEASWHIHGGRVILPGGPDHPVAKGLIQECREFREDDTHDHDDRVDAMTMAVSVWARKGGGR